MSFCFLFVVVIFSRSFFSFFPIRSLRVTFDQYTNTSDAVPCRSKFDSLSTVQLPGARTPCSWSSSSLVGETRAAGRTGGERSSPTVRKIAWNLFTEPYITTGLETQQHTHRTSTCGPPTLAPWTPAVLATNGKPTRGADQCPYFRLLSISLSHQMLTSQRHLQAWVWPWWPSSEPFTLDQFATGDSTRTFMSLPTSSWDLPHPRVRWLASGTPQGAAGGSTISC